MQATHGLVVGALVLAAACGDNADPGPYTLVLPARAALLLAAQDGDGPWQQLTPDAEGNVTFEVLSGRYGYAYVCARSALVRYGTPDLEAPPTWCSGPAAARPVLRGVTAPNARVFTSYERVDADETGAYTADVRTGTNDVVAILDRETPLMMIVHDLEVTGDTTLDLPIAVDGVAMPSMTPTVRGAGDGSVRVYADLNTVNGTYAYLDDDSATVAVPPREILAGGDRPAIGATEVTRTESRTAQRALGTSAPTLALPAWVAPQVDDTSARWAGDWDLVSVTLRRRAPNDEVIATVHHRADGAWIDEAGAGRVIPLIDVTTLPGWGAGMVELRHGNTPDWELSTQRGEYDGDYEGGGGHDGLGF